MPKVTTKYTPEDYKKLQQLARRIPKYAPKATKLKRFLLIGLLALVAFFGVMFSPIQFPEFLFESLACILVFFFLAVVLIYAILIIARRVRQKKVIANSPSFFDAIHEFSFNADDFAQIQTGDLAEGQSRAKYESIFKVYETEHYFFILPLPGQAYIVPKRDFVEGTPLELRVLLQAKLPPEKYVICK
ncbi:MAG: YcxB family protein [Christensenellaceae bacterium]|nr:YcxB family protein [Christensenellaceae bacterium]